MKAVVWPRNSLAEKLRCTILLFNVASFCLIPSRFSFSISRKTTNDSNSLQIDNRFIKKF